MQTIKNDKVDFMRMSFTLKLKYKPQTYNIYKTYI